MNETCDMSMLPNQRLALPTRLHEHQHQAGYHTIVLLLCVGVLAGSFLLRPHEDGLSLFGHRWPFHCRLYQTFGIKCALCGLSRSFCCLAHGDIAASLTLHPLGPATFALFCLEIPYRSYALASGSRTRGIALRRIHAGAVALVAVAIFANWLLYLGGLVL